MTKQFKITAFISLTIIILSLVSIIILSQSLETSDLTVEDEINSFIRIAVLNGCGRKGLALIFAQELRALGFDVVNGNGGNADSFDFDKSIVVDRKGNINKAETVAKVLGIQDVLDQYSANPYTIEDVVVILGRDWDTLKRSEGG